MDFGLRCRGRLLSSMTAVVGLALGLNVVLTGDVVAATVEGIRSSTNTERTRLVLDLDQKGTYSHRTLPDPPRIVVELPGSVFAPGVQTRSLSGGFVKRVRVNALRSGKIQAVLDLTRPLDYTIFTLDNPNRIVVDVKHAGQPESGAAKKPVVGDGTEKETPSPKKEPASPKKQTTSTPAKKTPEASKKKPATTTTPKKIPAKTPPPETRSDPGPSATEHPRAKLPPVQLAPPDREVWVVAIDAGHGGDDHGARHHRTSEKDITLELARELKRELEKNPRIKPILVRKGDYFIPLRRRWTLAEKQGAHLFVSLHCNASEDKHAAGTEVFFLSLKGATDEAARELAQFENAVDEKMGVEIQETDLDQIVFDMMQTDVLVKSQMLAEMALEKLFDLGTVYGRGVKQAGFAVLKSPRMPSILVEAAFISHKDEVKLLRDQGWRKKFGRQLAAGVTGYIQSMQPTAKASLEDR